MDSRVPVAMFRLTDFAKGGKTVNNKLTRWWKKGCDTLQDMRRNELRHEIEKGFASVARGEFAEYDRGEVLSIAEEVKAAGRLKREKAREAAK